MQIVINDVELEFDLFEAETAEKYTAAYEAVTESVENARGGGLAEVVRSQCEAVRNCFDTIFGEGTGIEVCGEKMSLFPHIDALEALTDEARKQELEMEKKNKALQTKYRGNRSQRRKK